MWKGLLEIFLRDPSTLYSIVCVIISQLIKSFKAFMYGGACVSRHVGLV